MSVRRQRAAGNKIITEQLKRLRQRQAEDSALEGALLLAQGALAEEPRSQLSCEMLIEYVPASIMQLEKAHCDECGKASDGWAAGWRFCPHCGSAITKAEREDTPAARHQRESVAEALHGLQDSFLTQKVSSGENHNE